MKHHHNPNAAILPEKLPLFERIMCAIVVTLVVIGAVYVSVVVK